MSDFTTPLDGLGDAFDSLAKAVKSANDRVNEKVAKLEATCAAMRSALENLIETSTQLTKAPRSVVMRGIAQAALASDAGRGWVSPDVIARTRQAAREELASELHAEVANLYGRIGGMGNAAEVFSAVFDILKRIPKEG